MIIIRNKGRPFIEKVSHPIKPFIVSGRVRYAELKLFPSKTKYFPYPDGHSILLLFRYGCQPVFFFRNFKHFLLCLCFELRESGVLILKNVYWAKTRKKLIFSDAARERFIPFAIPRSLLPLK